MDAQREAEQYRMRLGGRGFAGAVLTGGLGLSNSNTPTVGVNLGGR